MVCKAEESILSLFSNISLLVNMELGVFMVLKLVRVMYKNLYVALLKYLLVGLGFQRGQDC